MSTTPANTDQAVTTAERSRHAARGTAAAREAVANWLTARAELRAIDQAEHADIIDRFGRRWVWVSGDLWSHDRTLTIPEAWIATSKLPPATLAANHNYRRLCGICTSEWTQVERDQLAESVAAYERQYGAS